MSMRIPCWIVLNGAMSRGTQFLIPIIFICLIPLVLQGQLTIQTPIQHFSLADGLSNNSIMALHQDHDGYLWVGTSDGLNRFDGFEFQQYDGENGLRDGFISGIKSINDDQIVAASQNGIIHIYDKTQEKITIIEDSLLGRTFIHPGHAILGHDNYLLIGTSQGLVRYGLDGSTFTHILDNTSITCMQKSPSEAVLWLGTGHGLVQLDLNSLRVTNQYPVSEGVRAISILRNGNVLAITKSKVFQVDQANKTIQPIKEISLDDLNTICQDRNGNIWIGSQSGLTLLRGHNLEMDADLNEIMRHKGLDNLNITQLFYDREDNLWIGTANNGLIRLNLSPNRFTTFRQSDEARGGLSPENTVRALYGDADSILWIGSYGGGLYKFDRRNREFKRFEPGNNPGELQGGQVSAVFRDSKQRLWVGTWGDGLYQLREDNAELFKPWQISLRSEFQEYQSIHQIFEDELKNIWVASNGGLLVMRPESEEYDELTNLFHIPHVSINTVLEDNDGNWWIGTWSGLYIYSAEDVALLKTDAVTRIIRPIDSLHYQRDHLNTLGDDRITDIHQDHAGNIWVATYGGGINHVQASDQKMQVQRYTSLDGLPNETVYGIEEDVLGRLWLSTNDGLVLFNPERKSIQFFTSEDGLQSNQFYFGAHTTLEKGTLAFGGISGFNIFDPMMFRDWTGDLDNLIIRNITYNGRSITPDSRAGNSQITKLAIPYSDRIRIPYRDNDLKIDFSTITFNQHENISYQYQLENYDADWNTAGSAQPTVRYSHLSEGIYRFKVRASLDHQHWTEPKSIQIVVDPPWNRTWWARSLFVLLILGAIYLIARISYVYSNLKNKIKFEKIQRQQEKEVNEMRLWFFTYITHEFRSPLTLILSPLHEILKDNRTPESIKDKIGYAYRSSQKLMRLVDQLLNFRKINEGKLALKCSEENISEFSREICDSFSRVATKKHIKYEFNTSTVNTLIWYDPNRLELVLHNLLSNAFKYCEQGDQVVVSIHEDDNSVIISIQDSGPGIHPDDMDHLFEPYFQGKMNRHGSGIGLTIAKEITEMHGGELSVTSSLGVGTTFEVRLLKGNEHLSPDQITKEITGAQKQLLKPLMEWNSRKDYQQDVTLYEDGSKPRILIVEDDREILQYFQSCFEKEATVFIANDGESGYTTALKEQPDIIISDVIMPVLDGIGMSRALQTNEHTRHIPVILLTSKASVETKLEGINSGAIEYLTKPVNIAVLRAKVHSMLRNMSHLKSHFKHHSILQASEAQTPESEKFLLKAAKVVESNMTNNAFTADSFAVKMGMSRSGLYKKLRQETGKSTTQFIRYVRLKHAEKLLHDGHLNVSQTAFQVGFNDLKYFRKCFKKEFGMTPSELVHLAKDQTKA